MTLPSFKRNPTCSKCGHDGIAFDYRSATKWNPDERQVASCGFTSEEHFAEHIHLTCSRCGYGKGDPWVMAVSEDPKRVVGFRPRMQPA